jgi:hypothetical protein
MIYFVVYLFIIEFDMLEYACLCVLLCMSFNYFILCIFINLKGICKRKKSKSGLEVVYPSLWWLGML